MDMAIKSGATECVHILQDYLSKIKGSSDMQSPSSDTTLTSADSVSDLKRLTKVNKKERVEVN